MTCLTCFCSFSSPNIDENGSSQQWRLRLLPILLCYWYSFLVWYLWHNAHWTGVKTSSVAMAFALMERACAMTDGKVRSASIAVEKSSEWPPHIKYWYHSCFVMTQWRCLVHLYICSCNVGQSVRMLLDEIDGFDSSLRVLITLTHVHIIFTWYFVLMT